MPQNKVVEGLDLDQYKYDFRTVDKPVFRTEPGLSEDVVRAISAHKEEPEWMLEFRLKAYRLYLKKPMPTWGADLSDLENVLDKIHYYVRPQDRMKNDWEDVPENIKNTFDKLGIPEAEQKILAGVGAQYESEMVYHSLKKEWDDQGVIFDSIEDGLKNHPEFFRKYFASVIPPADNKFAALNSAVWSGGSFVYVPPGVHLDTPLQAYFRVNQERMGQFERTLIIIDEGAQAHYIEGCTGAYLFHRVVPLGGDRDRSRQERPLPLHDDPELVEQHVQPRHPAGPSERARDHGVAGRKSGIEGHHEISVVLFGGRGSARLHPVHCLRRRRAAPGYGGEGRARGAPHHVVDRLQVDL